MKIEIISDPDDNQIHEIRYRLQEYNDPFWEVKEKYKFVITAREDFRLTGGLVFTIFGQWVELDFFWIDPELRNKGLGQKILREMESFAISKGCLKAFTNTFSFQAKPFYEKMGYQVVYTQEKFPVSNTRYFMEKSLVEKEG